MTVVLGVDPGAMSTGLVVRQGDALGAHTTVVRQARWSRAEWIEAVLDAVVSASAGVELVCVEDVNTPTPALRKKLIDPTPLLDTAAIAGAVAGWAWSGPLDVVWVPPYHNGHGHRSAYPPALWGPREGDAGTGVLRHCRSGWDVAGMGLRIHGGKSVA